MYSLAATSPKGVGFEERQSIEFEQLDLEDMRDLMMSPIGWADGAAGIVGKMPAPQT